MPIWATILVSLTMLCCLISIGLQVYVAFNCRRQLGIAEALRIEADKVLLEADDELSVAREILIEARVLREQKG